MTTTASPAADARTVGLAHYAARAVLERVLARHGITFQEQITLRLAVVAEAPPTREALVEQVAGSLKVDASAVADVIDGLLAKGLLAAEGPQVRASESGRAFYAGVSAETARYSARIWGDIPQEDLAAAGRVLTLVTERANAELAAMPA
ncbi:MarR family transcriptional regulator [Streptomyces sp. 7R007]